MTRITREGVPGSGASGSRANSPFSSSIESAW
jgi:hypothetical protein